MSVSATPETEPSAALKEVAGVVLLRQDGAALLQLREQKPGLPDAGNWVFPGGHCDDGESIEDCARREFLEETNYECDRLFYLTDFVSSTAGPRRHFTFFWHRFDARQELRCLEGEAIEFVSRENSPPNAPDYLPMVWDLALTAAEEIRLRNQMGAYIVPYTFFHGKNAAIRTRLVQAFESVIDSGRYIMGPETDAFQREFADYCQTSHSIGLADGTAALHIVLRALGIGPGDEVITAPNSFIASAASIALVGAKPVFVDVRDDLNLDPEKLEAALTAKTRAIMPVHLTGRPARMKEILAIAKAHDLYVVEDAAQAVGARLDGKRVGSWGIAGCFSLHPLKNLHAFGDGGMVSTSDADLAGKVSQIRNHGLRNREQCDFWGFNARLDELQAALLRVQLPELDSWTEERRRLAFRYNELLKPFVKVPEENAGEYCVYQTYVIQAERRDDLRTFLVKNGVEALVHYAVPIHLQPAARTLGYDAGSFSMTSRVCAQILSLPLYPGLTHEQQDIVADSIGKFYRAA